MVRTMFTVVRRNEVVGLSVLRDLFKFVRIFLQRSITKERIERKTKMVENIMTRLREIVEVNVR